MPHVILRWKLRHELAREFCAERGLDFTKYAASQEITQAVEDYLDALPAAYADEIQYGTIWETDG